MNKIITLSEVLDEFFNKTAKDIALETGFIKRKRKLTGSSFIKAMVLGNLGNENCSLDVTTRNKMIQSTGKKMIQ